MVEIKEIVEDAVEDVEEAVEEGIFDEDLESVEDEVSDFDIGNTMLSVAPAVESWQGQNLEDTISRERIEKDWSGDDELVTGDFYKSSESSSDVYSAGSASGSDVYGSGSSSGSDVYGSGSAGGSDVYSAGGSGAYSSGKSDGSYSVQGENRGRIKSYEELKDDRRGRKSMLEIAGFEGTNMQKKEDSRSDVEYSSSGAK